MAHLPVFNNLKIFNTNIIKADLLDAYNRKNNVYLSCACRDGLENWSFKIKENIFRRPMSRSPAAINNIFTLTPLTK